MSPKNSASGREPIFCWGGGEHHVPQLLTSFGEGPPTITSFTDAQPAGQDCVPPSLLRQLCSAFRVYTVPSRCPRRHMRIWAPDLFISVPRSSVHHRFYRPRRRPNVLPIARPNLLYCAAGIPNDRLLASLLGTITNGDVCRFIPTSLSMGRPIQFCHASPTSAEARHPDLPPLRITVPVGT